MPSVDIAEPFVGSTLWVARAWYFLAIPALVVTAVYQRDWGWAAMAIFASIAAIGFELFVTYRRSARLRIFCEGRQLVGIVVGKRETARGPLSKIRVRYKFEGQTFESEQAVSPVTFHRSQVDDEISIRISDDHPRTWIPA